MSMSPAFDEMWAEGSAVRRPYKNIKAWLDSEDRPSLKANEDANDLFRLTGITFNVYGSSGR